jgi:single-stranded-DNA-specific exonuclease
MIFQSNIWSPIEVSSEDIDKYSPIFKTEPLITKLLLHRGFKRPEDVEAFLKPSISQLHDPFKLTDMADAVNRVNMAIESGEQIWIYGDYDVDGITSIAILLHYFRFIGIEAHFYIPDRHDEGYGISEAGIDHIKSQGGQLIITVDCGITAVDQATYAKAVGIDLIITDHHECQDILPEAVAVVNPKREGYPFKMLAGCGVAFKLVQALSGQDFDTFYPLVIDILALGTIADIVPLYDENRIFAKLGLEAMQHSKRPGIKALIHEANLKYKEVNAGHIGFVIAPRINASGRIGNPDIAVKLLTTDNEDEAKEIAKMLSELNSERQSRERDIMVEAETYIAHHINLETEKVLLVVGKDWHTGIIGIVASKLSEKYSRPTVILNIENGMAKGSARSIDGISIFKVLNTFKDLFEKFGGHDQAAGLSLKSDNVAVLKQALITYGKEHLPSYRLKIKKTVDGELFPKMVSHKLLDEIEELKPFGVGNPRPQFIFKNLIIEDFKRLGKQQNHLKLMVNDGVRVYDAMAFNQGELSQYFRRNDRVHMLLYLEKNNFMGVETIQFMLRDMIKNRMPMPFEIREKLAKAETVFLKSERALNLPDKFTKIEDFDIIFSTQGHVPLCLYSPQALLKFKDYVLGKNYYEYTLHFNHIDSKESREGIVDVVYMPVTSCVENLETAYVYDEALQDKTLAGFIPNRDDVAFLYKHLSDNQDITLEQLESYTNMSLTKCLLSLALMEAMGLYHFEKKGAFLKLSKKPSPKNKVDIENIALYRHLIDSWRRT